MFRRLLPLHMKFFKRCELMIAVCPNPFRDIDLNITRQVTDMLNNAGFETAVCPIFADDEPGIIPSDINVVKLENIADKCSLIIVIGGDGTILSVARTLHEYSIPILGVNLGTMGFMAALEADNLPLILKAANGEMSVSRRMKLDVSVIRDGAIVCSDCALNDAVIHGYGDCIKLTANCGGDIITSFAGDGIILAPPTGSTGYSMTAGGPIVEPDTENIIISPICAHMLGARSFVLDSTREIYVTAEKLHGRRAYLAVDGISVCDLVNGDTIKVKRSAQYTPMVNMGLKSFFDVAYEKLT